VTETATNSPTTIHWTATCTSTATSSATSTATLPPETHTATPTFTPEPGELFISKNYFTSGSTVEIAVSIHDYPGSYNLSIFNSAGENITVLGSGPVEGPFSKTFSWDGKNKYGAKCASGVYVVYLAGPVKRLLGRVVLVH